MINGLLLGGVLALLALGLNLIFGVIDVVWIEQYGTGTKQGYKRTPIARTMVEPHGSISGSHGLPKGPYGRIGLSVAANSDRVFALIEAAEGGVYRSDDSGETWQLVDDGSFLPPARLVLHAHRRRPARCRHGLRA